MATTAAEAPAGAPDLKSMVISNARKAKTLYADAPGRKRIRLDPGVAASDPDLSREALSLRLHAEYAEVQTLPEALAAKQAAAAGARRKVGGGAAKKQAAAAEAPSASEEKARKMIEGIQESSKPPRPGPGGPQSSALVHVRKPQQQGGERGGTTAATGQQLVRLQDVHTEPRPEWHPPWKLTRVVSGHLGWVRALAVEPDNQWFASGAGDRTIKIWDLVTGSLRLTLTGHISTVRGLAVSPRHPYLFSCGEDKM